MMPSRSRLLFLVLLGGAGWVVGAAGAEPAAVPKVADGWAIRPIEQAPRIAYPTAIVVAPDGTIYLGQDPMNMPGPVTAPIDSVLQIRPDGSTRVFASRLQSVMGLEWVDGTLFVVHAPFLSSFRDTNGDGVGDVRTDLVTGLGPKVPGANGLNDHIASGVRLGMDGFLYVSVGDKGIPLARGTDGKTITLSTGGVIRVRPDGSDLEVVSSGERNPLSVALSARDDVFTFGNDDDSHLWPNSLTHHIVGGHYGYPYEFRDAPHRALPIMAGQAGGAGAQGVCSNDAGLPERFRGNLFFCDWGLGAVARYEVEPKGATFRVVRREAIVEQGGLADFRPFGIAPTADGAGFYITDWAYTGWLASGPPTGRLFRLDYIGADRPAPARKLSDSPDPGLNIFELAQGLHHPTLAVRLRYQRAVARQGEAGEKLVRMVATDLPSEEGDGSHAGPTRCDEVAWLHKIWALDAINSPTARATIRAALVHRNAVVREQAARSSGIRRDGAAEAALVGLLAAPEPPIRREAAIALGRLAAIAPATRAALYAALGDPDPTVAWAVRRAIRDQNAADPAALAAALGDPARRDSALTLADGWYAPEVVRVLVAHLGQPGLEIRWRVRVVAALGGLYARVPAWSGTWFGSNPAAGPKPKPTQAWHPASSDAVLGAMAQALRDGDAGVRRQGMIACLNVGPRATPLLRALLGAPLETDPTNILALVRYLGEQRDSLSVAALGRKLADPAQPEEVRLAAFDALGQLTGPVALNARLMVLYDAGSPDALLARALPSLGRARVLPSNDLVGFLDHKSGAVRAAALGAFPTEKPLPGDVVEAIMLRADDPSPEVRTAFVSAAGTYKIRAALPRLIEEAAGTDRSLRAEATRALAAIPDRSAVGAFAAALNDRDPDLRRVGLTGLTAIRDEAIPEITALARRGAFVGPGALAVERLLATFRPVTEWRVIGPFPRATGAIFDQARAIDFARTVPGLDGKPLAWQLRRGDAPTGLVRLDDLAGPAADPETHPFTAFAVTEVDAREDHPAILIVDATGPTLVTLGDRPVGHFPAGANSETLRVDFRAGVNRIILRTRETHRPWSIRVALAESEPSGGSMATPPQTASFLRAGLGAFARNHNGDSKNGAALFAEAGGLHCARCHAVEGTPATNPGLGPDLSGLARKYDKSEVIRSVLEPSARIAVGYHPVQLARRDGTSVVGLIGVETAGAIDLATADGRHVTIPRSEIGQQQPAAVSIMPEGLVDRLTPVEFADLIAYLMTLKEVPDRSSARR